MRITDLEKTNRSKINVFIDGEYVFWLMPNEVTRYQLAPGKEITTKTFDLIREEVVLRRAKQKALSLLKIMDRTQQELYRKLHDSRYPDDIIEQTMNYIMGYGYLNDERYAASYIRERKYKKSRMVLQMELLKKGIPKDILDQVMVVEYGKEETDDPEIVAIRKVIEKKIRISASFTWEEKQKLGASLYRRGFALDKINRVLEEKLNKTMNPNDNC